MIENVCKMEKQQLNEEKLINIINESINEVISEMKLTPQQLAYLSGKAYGLSKDKSKGEKYMARKGKQATRFGLGVEFHPDSIKRNNGDSGYEYDYFQPYVNDMDSEENPIVVKRFQYNINPNAQILTQDRYKNGPDDRKVYYAKSVDKAVNGGYEKTNDAFKAGRQNATRDYELEKALFKSFGDEKF